MRMRLSGIRERETWDKREIKRECERGRMHEVEGG